MEIPNLRNLRKRSQPEPRQPVSGETLGERLRNARLARKLSPEDVARETRMRPDRIEDIERDEFKNFPSTAYARSFVLMYAKYLNTDVLDGVQNLQTPTRIGVDNYAYLQNAPTRIPEKIRPRRQTSTLSKFLVIGAVLLAFFIMYLIRQGDRLGPEFQGSTEQAAPVILSNVPSPTPVSTPVATPPPAPKPTVAPTAVPLPQLRDDVPRGEEQETIDNLPVKRAVPLDGE